MKKYLIFLGLILILFYNLVSVAGAKTYEFQPNRFDLYDLDHYNYYKWGIGLTIPHGETLNSVTLEFDDIRDWEKETNVLYVHLLDSAPIGVTILRDNQNGGDNFANQGIKLFTWNNLPDYAQDRAYSLTDEQMDIFMTYVSDGNIGFGFDPDCHFYNNGVTLKAQTVVPEPATLLLLGSGFIGIGIYIRRKTR